MRNSVNDFFLRYYDETDAHVVVYPNGDVASEALAQYQSRGAKKLFFPELIDVNALSVPNATDAFAALKDALKCSSEQLVVVGLDAYLTMFCPESSRKSFLSRLSEYLDDPKTQKTKVAFFLHRSNFLGTLKTNPKYEGGLQVFQLSGDEPYDVKQPELTQVPSELISERFVEDGVLVTNVRETLQRLGEFMPNGEKSIVFARDEREKNPIKGFSVLTERETAERFFKLPNSFPRQALRPLLKRSCEENKYPKDFLEDGFGKSNLNKRLSLSRLLELDDEFWQGYLWLIGNKVEDDSYLKRVVSSNPKRVDLARRYIVDEALNALQQEQESTLQRYAAERADAIKSIPQFSVYQSLIAEFVEHARPYKFSYLFFNCETPPEQLEIVRLTIQKGEKAEKYRGRFSLLDDYLAPFPECGSPELAEYFNNYRRYKVKQIVAKELVDAARQGYELAQDQESRDMALAPYKNQDDVATLVVDGMGAEYLPALVYGAKRRGLRIAESRVVCANLPTSTEFNSIYAKNLLDQIKKLDNIAHNGAEKNESNDDARNLFEATSTFNDVFSRVSVALGTYRQVVVTADHGTSRLAKLAHDMKLSQTIAVDSPDDWRYTRERQNMPVPGNVIKKLCADKDQYYWIARGYDRFSKPGGKLNELHGGASPEELLVPFVVFTRDVVDETLPVASVSQDGSSILEQDDAQVKTATEQFEEDEDFANL